jgi:hypothetical protein
MLDLTRIAAQISEAGRRTAEQRRRAAEETARAADVAQMGAAEWAVQVERLRASRTSWLVAHSEEGSPGQAFPAPPAPASYAVVAADGSQIAPDRHEGVGGCYLMNVGRVLIPYGIGTRPRLDSLPEILTFDAEDEEAERVAVAGDALRRFAREMNALAGLIAEAKATGLSALALTDGSLIAWNLEDETGDNAAKQEAFAALAATLNAAREAHVPLVGYVSSPGSRDVVNGLRVTLCPAEPMDNRRCPHPKDACPCSAIRRATDAGLYARLLKPGERSPVFTARGQETGYSKILKLYDPAQWVAFFYLHAGAEIARVEFPAWVAENPESVNLVHALCLDQARKGRGYPVALAEAHEQAVVRGPDREAFLHLLRRAMVQEGTSLAPTRKALAKRTRAV